MSCNFQFSCQSSPFQFSCQSSPFHWGSRAEKHFPNILSVVTCLNHTVDKLSTKSLSFHDENFSIQKSLVGNIYKGNLSKSLFQPRNSLKFQNRKRSSYSGLSYLGGFIHTTGSSRIYTLTNYIGAFSPLLSRLYRCFCHRKKTRMGKQQVHISQLHVSVLLMLLDKNCKIMKLWNYK